MILFPFRFIVQSTEIHFTKEQLMAVKGKKKKTLHALNLQSSFLINST